MLHPTPSAARRDSDWPRAAPASYVHATQPLLAALRLIAATAQCSA